jgi:RecJ-like exonuclease
MSTPDGITCPTCGGSKIDSRVGQVIGDVLHYSRCPTCGGTGRLYTRDDLDAAVKVERERIMTAAVIVVRRQWRPLLTADGARAIIERQIEIEEAPDDTHTD